MFEPCLIFEGKEASYPTGDLKEVLHFSNRFLALSVKIGLGWSLTLANPLAYRDASLLKEKFNIDTFYQFNSNMVVKHRPL